MTLSPDGPLQKDPANKIWLVRWIFLAIGGLFTLVGAWLLYGSYSFQQTAIITTAEVLSVEKFVSRKRDNDGNTKTSITYEPTLRYKDQYGSRHVDKPNLRSSSYNFPIGSEVEIAFNPDDPAELRINDFMSKWGFGGFFMLFGLVFMTIGWVATRSIERKREARAGTVVRMR